MGNVHISFSRTRHQQDQMVLIKDILGVYQNGCNILLE